MKLFFLTLLICLSNAFAYHILCIFPAPSKSHDHLAEGIVRALLKAGHEVTWATPFPKEVVPANLTIIDLPVTRALISHIDVREFNNKGLNYMRNVVRNISITAAENPELRRVLVEKKFDAVVNSWYFNDYEAGYAAIQQVPWILLSSVIMHPYLEYFVDEVRSISTIPLMFNDCPTPMSVGRRMLNGLFYLLMSIDAWFDQPRVASLYESLYAPLAAARGVPLPPIHEAKHNISFLFVNSHESTVSAQCLPPNVINIAGYHINEDPAPLPKDLQDILDNSPQGVIYFSMGSLLRSSKLTKQKRDALLQMFAALPHTVLWKFEEPLEDLPPNVHVKPWFPQASLLGHKNIRLFITHGGQLSTLEAIHAGVPLLAIPVFGDQHSNAERAVRTGFAVKISYDNMVEEMAVALKEMVENDTYYNKAKYLSKLFRGRPVPPSKLISHYIELAIETKGAHHLRSPSLQYKWYERWMIDFVIVLLAVIAALVAIVSLVIRTCIRKLRGKSNKKENANKKKN